MILRIETNIRLILENFRWYLWKALKKENPLLTGFEWIKFWEFLVGN